VLISVRNVQSVVPVVVPAISSAPLPNRSLRTRISAGQSARSRGEYDRRVPPCKTCSIGLDDRTRIEIPARWRGPGWWSVPRIEGLGRG